MSSESDNTQSSPAATSAAPASNGEVSVSEERVREELKNVIDPEIGLDVISLGLIYDVKIDAGSVAITMTLTTPMCPVGPMFISNVQAAVVAIPGVKDCKVDLTFNPPWDPRTMASDEAKMMMGFYY